MTSLNNYHYHVLLGTAIGDALGYPVQFKSRQYLKANPVTDMLPCREFNDIAGVWSDDTSLTLCLAENLKNGIHYDEIAQSMVKWLYDGYMTPIGSAFDEGITTAEAIRNIKSGIKPVIECGLNDYDSNGNGSLMRILPLAFYMIDTPVHNRMRIVKDISSITHGHWISVYSCIILIEMAIELIKGADLLEGYSQSVKRCQNEIPFFIGMFSSNSLMLNDIQRIFGRLLSQDILLLSEDQIKSSGYVVDTLECALWSLLNTDNFHDAVVTAVNLGNDCDTIGAVTGGIAGLYYGIDSIPDKWINTIQGIETIKSVCL